MTSGELMRDDRGVVEDWGRGKKGRSERENEEKMKERKGKKKRNEIWSEILILVLFFIFSSFSGGWMSAVETVREVKRRGEQSDQEQINKQP